MRGRRLLAGLACAAAVFAAGVTVTEAPAGERPAGAPAASPATETPQGLERRTRKPPYWKRCRTGYRCARAVLPRYFPRVWRYALQIVRCETGGTYSAYAVGAAGERGPFQVHPVHFGWVNEQRLFDYRYSSRIARRLSHGGTDWSAWTCSRYV